MLNKTDIRILLIDDDPGVVNTLLRILAGEGYCQVRSATDSRRAVAAFTEFAPDLVVLDLMMPGLDGFAVMEQLRPLVPEYPVLPILVLSGEVDPLLRRRALAQGAADLVQKPCDPVEFTLRVRHLLESRALRIQLERQNQTLEERVRERTLERDQAQGEMLQRLAIAAEARDDDTGQHTQRVGRLSGRLARALGLPEEQVAFIRQTAPLHDVGKIGVPDSVLLKPGKLTTEEYEVMKQHTVLGSRILADGQWPLMQTAERIARSHHERWDGTGYPDQLAGESIPMEARIVALVDVFDALSHARPYRPAWEVERVMAYLEQGRGRQFDPVVLDAFQAMARRGIRSLTDAYSSGRWGRVAA